MTKLPFAARPSYKYIAKRFLKNGYQKYKKNCADISQVTLVCSGIFKNVIYSNMI